MQLPQKIPTLLGIFLLLGFVSVFIGGFEFISQINTQAAVTKAPVNIHVSSLTDTNAIISWLTNTEVTGFVEITSPKKHIFYDQRDQIGKLGKYKTHFVTLSGLNPLTIYSFSINSQNSLFPQTDLTFKTLSPLVGTTGLEPAYGVVESTSGSPASGAIVILTPIGGQPLAALTQPSGSYLFNLSTVRTKNGDQPLTVSEDRLTEEIIIDYPGNSTSAITDTLNDSPVPTILIGKSYDFRRQQGRKPESPSFLAQNTSPTTPQPSSTFTITNPLSGTALPTDLPFFKGTGIPGNQVTLTIGITRPFLTTLKVASDGTWYFAPAKPLGTGKQSVTATSRDNLGKAIAITHLFEILKSGTQVLGDATPSATLSPQPSPTLAPAPIDTPTPLSTTSGEPMPISGNEMPTLILIITGLFLFTSGLLLTI